MNSNLETRMNFKPCLVVLSGLPLSGKSHLAKILKQNSNLTHIDVDEVRGEFEKTGHEVGPAVFLGPDRELDIMVQCYTELCNRAEALVHSGVPVVVSGTFSRLEFKEPLRRLLGALEEKEVPVHAFRLSIPDREARERLERRKVEGGFSNIDSLEKYEWAKSIFTPIDFVPLTEINTSHSQHAERVISVLKYLNI